MKKAFSIIAPIVCLVLILIFTLSFYTLKPNETAIVLQFGQSVKTVSEPGIYLKIPFIQGVKKIYTGEQLYDLDRSEVITSDKKTMIGDLFTIWSINDALKYHQTVASPSVATGRIDVSVYNAMKNHISSITQDDVISGKDGSLGEAIAERIDNLSSYGITIADIEMKAVDLPETNKEAVYKRMISERNVIAARYTAEGEKVANESKNNVDSQVRVILAEAKTKAANLEAEGEEAYFRILADAYSKNDDVRDFYEFLIGLESVKKSLVNGGTLVIDETSPIYSIISGK